MKGLISVLGLVKRATRQCYCLNYKLRLYSQDTAVNDEEEDKNVALSYLKNRRETVEKWKQDGLKPYPHKFTSDITVKEFTTKYDLLQPGEYGEGDVAITGRIMSMRRASKQLVFYDLLSDGANVQIMASKSKYGEAEAFAGDMKKLSRGDVIGVKGLPHRTKTGELSVVPSVTKLLSPCLHKLPGTYIGLNEKTLIAYRKRYLDLLLNPASRQTFITRSKILKHIRDYLENKDFIEVETPMLTYVPSGAAARPFMTYLNYLHTDMYLRVAPELYLKQLVIGGMDRVFEIGKQFRNEALDATHNPEFTTCEFYMAHSDYKDLISMTEDMLSGLVEALHGSYKFKYVNSAGEEMELDWSPPYKQVSLVDMLVNELGINMEALAAESDENLTLLKTVCDNQGVPCDQLQSVAQCVDKLCGKLIEDLIIHPTFITDHPVITSPLAKEKPDNPHVTERFELVVMGKEICNAYTELNDPVIQRERFARKETDDDGGEDHVMDAVFIEALEYGLPPTGGWGVGIDRLVMLLTNTNTIRDVQLFPLLKQNPSTTD